MSENQPSNTDAILGGQNPPPVDAFVLGGVAGARQRLAHKLGVSIYDELVDLFLNELNISDELAYQLSQNHDIFSFETLSIDRYGGIILCSQKQSFYYTENLGNGIFLDMMYVPAGTFMMGSIESYEREHLTFAKTLRSKLTIEIGRTKL